MKKSSPVAQPVVLVTGLSGAGLSTALKALEDIGYDTVDNLPLRMIEPFLLQNVATAAPIALGLDARARDFAAQAVLQHYANLQKNKRFKVTLLFIDCADDVLIRRYTESRRPHPSAQGRPVKDGIARERTLLAPLRAAADQTIDSSDLIAANLRKLVQGHFAVGTIAKLQIFVQSFAYRYGIPREADLVFDARFLQNPHYVAKLKDKTGLDQAVQDYVKADAHYPVFIKQLTTLLKPLLPRYQQEGKSYLTIAIGCTGGQHRSVTVAEDLAFWLETQGYSARLIHRELERKS